MEAFDSVAGAPEQDFRSLRLPDTVSESFVACFAALPGGAAFEPNVRSADSAAQLLRFGNAGALALLLLLRRHCPHVAEELRRFEQAVKGEGGQHPPHLRLENLRVGVLAPEAALPTSDDPAVDPAAYAARPCLSELLLLSLNTVLGFAPMVVSGEKAGLPVHHHVPVDAHACSGTSVSFKRPVAVHTEDLHVGRLYGHFTLFGKLGNAAAYTPLWTVRGFMARVPADARGWVARALALPFLMCPGAGRMDAARERHAAPILTCHWDGRAVLRYNAADYASLRDGSRILRVQALPAEWYRSADDHDLAQCVLPLLRSLFADVDDMAHAPPSAAMSHALSSLVLRSGDALLVSNKAGPHCRSTFPGKRYVQRLYADYGAEQLWDASLNFGRAEERVAHLAACVARDFDADQLAHLEHHLGVPLAHNAQAAGDHPAPPDAALAAALASLEAAIDDCAHLLLENGPGSPAVQRSGGFRELLDPLRRLHCRLGQLRRGGAASWRGLPPGVLPPLRACCDALRPLAFSLRDDNLSAELARVRSAAAAPGAVERIAAAIQAALDALAAQRSPMHA